MLKVGIFGGTFDPVHIEHINLAKIAIEKLSLDKLIVVPTFLPPHKAIIPASGQDRLNMLKLAFNGVERVEISDFELKSEGKSYSYITVEHFKKTLNADLYFFVGADMLKDFPTWKYPERIVANCTLVAFGREDYLVDYSKTLSDFKARFNSEFIRLNYEGKDFSSTKIRIYSSLGLPIDNQTDDNVCEYIKENNLYAGDVYTEFVKSVLPEKRLIHTAEVVITAMQKTKELSLDGNKVVLAALLHDCAKYVDYTTVSGFSLPDGMPKPVVHAFLGAYIIERVLGVKDQEVIDAVRYHTSGKADMTTLGKLILVADMIEPNRDYEGVDKLRELYKKDFDECFIECIKEETLHLQNKKQDVYFETINAYNYYVKGIK